MYSGDVSKKNVDLGPFDLASRLFGQASFRSMNLSEKMDLYFTDYQLLPAFVQVESIHQQRPYYH